MLLALQLDLLFAHARDGITEFHDLLELPDHLIVDRRDRLIRYEDLRLKGLP